MPICGHATIAAHYARAKALGIGASTLTQKTGAGLQKIEIQATGDGDIRIRMHQGPIKFEAPLAAEHCNAIRVALRLAASDLRSDLPLQVVSTVHSKIMVPLADHVSIDSLQPDLVALTAISARIGCNGFFPFKLRSDDRAATDGRMFAPAIGIAEDPVTGNANGPLGAYLVRHRAMPHDGTVLRFTGHQGRALQRDGIVHVEVGIADAEPIAVSFAGDAVIFYRADDFFRQ